MDASPGNRMEQLLTDFAERYAAVSKATAQMDALSVTAQSRDGVVEASVGVNGRAPTVRFISKRCRDMTYSELAEDVLDALTTARAEAAIRISTLRRDAGTWLSGRMAPTLESNTGIWGTSSAPRQLDMISSSDAPGSSALGLPRTCWRWMVQEARVVAAGDVSGFAAGAQSTGSATKLGSHGVQVTTTECRKTRSAPQSPLWGKDRPGLRSGSGYVPLPAELCDAVIALGDSICASVGCTCLAAASQGRNGRMRPLLKQRQWTDQLARARGNAATG